MRAELYEKHCGTFIDGEVEDICILQRPGDTPYSYSDNPGCLLGPWSSVEKTFDQYEKATGERIIEFWTTESDNGTVTFWLRSQSVQ